MSNTAIFPGTASLSSDPAWSSAPGTFLERLPDHQGSTEHKPFLFFAAPPPEIGTLKSAESTLRQGAGRMPLILRLFIAGAIALGTFVLMGVLASLERAGTFRDWLYCGVILVPPFGFLYGMFATRFQGTCSYVGQHGVSRGFIEKRPSAPPKTDLLLFAQAAELRASQTRHFVKGIYTGTSYEYSWNDENDVRLYCLKGKYQGNNKPPKPGDPFHFARAAEMSWSLHYLERAEHHLRTEGSIPFRVDRTRWIRVGAGFMEFHFGGQPVSITRDEIAKVSLCNGAFSFKHKDARWFSSEGKYAFSYGRMSNAMVFLMALERLMGYQLN